MSERGMNSGKKTEKEADLQNDPDSGSSQASAGEERSPCARNCHTLANFDEDFTPLPSPSRSALRPSYSPPRSKDLRVTFQQESSTESLRSRPLSRALNDTASLTQWITGRSLTPTQRKHETESPFLDSVPTEDPTLQSSHQVLDLQYFTDTCWPTFKPSVTAMTWPLPRKSLEVESDKLRTDKLLRLSSDLYEVTHLPDVAIPVRSFSGECPEQSSPDCSLSTESLSPYKHKHKPQQTLSTQTAPWRPNERPARGLETKKQTSLPADMRACYPDPVLQPDGPDLGSVLRALLDLVDQHWSGPLSLHLSPSFMAKAIRLLMPLTSPVPPLQNETMKEVRDEQHGMEDSREWWDVWDRNQEKREQENVQAGVEERRCCGLCSSDFDGIEAGYLKKQLAKTENELESLRKRLISSLKENYTLRSDKKKKATACLRNEDLPFDLSAYLQKESKVLQEHEQRLKQLEKRVHLLQSNQRSLVSHNNSLLNVIKRTSSKLSETV